MRLRWPTYAVTLALAFGALVFMQGDRLLAQHANTDQTTARETPLDTLTMPTDAEAILTTASNVNGLHGPNLQPWHAKLTYQKFDDDGKVQTEGTFEESWISDKSYEQSYTSPDFAQTDYATNDGLFRTGVQAWPKLAETQVSKQLAVPVLYLPDLPDVQLKKKEVTLGSTRLECVIFTSTKLYLLKDSYCFDADRPILRLEVSPDGFSQVTYNGIVEFQGRFVARNVQRTYKSKPLLKVHVDDLGPPASTSITPPPDAIKIAPDKILLAGEAMTSRIISQAAPVYPSQAKVERVQGTVVMEATVEKDGSVSSVQYVSGPEVLQQSAMDALKKWRYEPFLFLGEPIQVRGYVSIIYTLN